MCVKFESFYKKKFEICNTATPSKERKNHSNYKLNIQVCIYLGVQTATLRRSIEAHARPFAPRHAWKHSFITRLKRHKTCSNEYISLRNLQSRKLLNQHQRHTFIERHETQTCIFFYRHIQFDILVNEVKTTINQSQSCPRRFFRLKH